MQAMKKIFLLNHAEQQLAQQALLGLLEFRVFLQLGNELDLFLPTDNDQTD
jgi:hypothetical protein